MPDVLNFSAWCVGDKDSTVEVEHQYQYEEYHQFYDSWLPTIGIVMAMCPMDAIQKVIDRLNKEK